MQAQVIRIPFFVILMGLGALSMLIPAVHGAVVDDHNTMRVFFYGTILFSILTLLVGLATYGYNPSSVTRSQLLTILAAFTFLPLMFAVPFAESIPSTTYLHAWFEMVSSFSTTGATLYDQPSVLTPSLHLWRATVGWMGGFLMWITAIAILAPMNLGGFEVRARDEKTNRARLHQFAKSADPSERLVRHALAFAPVYLGLTFVLALGLSLSGENALYALCHAMSVMSTSGISPALGSPQISTGFWGELVVIFFFVFALSRFTFSRTVINDAEITFRGDKELKVAFVLIAGTTIVLLARHFVGSITEFESETNQIFAAIWGTLFTVTSFLTTTGIESQYWNNAAAWSGQETPGLFLLGLALIGGGVATTAGGVKLLRVYALYQHSEREMERLLHPSSVGGGGKDARRIRRQGAYISWVSFMLFAISLALVMIALSLTGVTFADAMALSVAALSTTGPLAGLAAENPISYSLMPEAAKLVLAAAMIVGRLEALALIALLNPEIWRS